MNTITKAIKVIWKRFVTKNRDNYKRVKSHVNSRIEGCQNRKEGVHQVENTKAMDSFNLHECIQLSKKSKVNPYSGNEKLFYCEGVKHLFNKLNCHWLLDEINHHIVSVVWAAQSDDDRFDSPRWGESTKIELKVTPDHTAVLTAIDAWRDDEPWLKHKMKGVHLPVLKEPLQFCLGELGAHHYCLAIASS